MAQTVDLADVRLVLSLEAPLRTVAAILENGGDEALDRLSQAEYAGAGTLSDQLFGGSTPADDSVIDGLLNTLEDLRIADGNETVWWHRFLMVRLDLDLPDAITELLGVGGDKVNLVKPFIEYAQSVA